MNPIYHQATFIMSAPSINQAPEDTGREIAFAGRSNAGKSSTINSLTQQKSLARISKTPGRTQLLNFFQLTETNRFVDLPGFGYAKVPLAVKKDWHKMMENYLLQRKSLSGIVLVMDIRHPLTEFDWQMIHWCQHSQVPLHILLNKCDKMKYGASKNILMQVEKQLHDSASPVTTQLFSSLKKTGIQELQNTLDIWLALNQKEPD